VVDVETARWRQKKKKKMLQSSILAENFSDKFHPKRSDKIQPKSNKLKIML
jgi:hypothetical protein